MQHRFAAAVTSMMLAVTFVGTAARAAEFPTPKQGTWIAKDFKFHTGEAMAELRLAYTTIGEPTGEPVLVLHGTTGSAASLTTPTFGGELFGKGQPLDAASHFIIIPDSIGHGKSSKPSDGLRAKFPKYNSNDMVEAQYRLIKEGLGVRHLRLVIGNSMGGMHTWIWGTKHPEYMDALVPMASETGMASRNWMLRRLMIDTIRKDPEYKSGDYTAQPHSLHIAAVFFNTATNGGSLAYRRTAPTRMAADKLVDSRLAAPFKADANDFIYQWDSSGDYDVSPDLERIEAAVLAINSADDERNPPETGLMEREMKRVKNGRFYLIPASENTAGHGTTGMAKFWSRQLGEFLQAVPKRAM